ncbi:Origin recognition complex, subunit 1 [Podila epicladia]|nr:Origin recognition complex, subunit 1 [Podila epicladia]KAG0096732.1 Origin recognition complex, subunit 1 [Podila epicladia]
MVTTSQRVHKRLEKSMNQIKRNALKPQSDSESEDELEWVGEPINKDSFLRRERSSAENTDKRANNNNSDVDSKSTRRATRGSGLSNIPLYKSFKKGDTTYTLGDIVLLQNEFYTSKFDHPHVAQILSLCETEDGEFEGEFRWFHQAEDIEKFKRRQRKGNFPDGLENGELVYSLDDDKNDISTVVAKCTVLSEPEWRKRYGSTEANLPKSDQHLVWFCRGIVKKFSGYESLEWTTNENMMKIMEEKEARPRKMPSAPTSRRVQITTVNAPKVRGGSKALASKTAVKKRGRKSEDSEVELESEPEEDKSESDFDKDNDSDDNPFLVQPKKTPVPKKQKAVVKPKRARITAPTAPARRSKTLIVQKPTTQRAIEATVPQTDYEHARNRLHVKAVPDTLPCREDEFAEIQDQLRYAIEDGTGSCIYISGVPGTGKTATVHRVIQALKQEAEEGELADFQFVEINGMKVTEPSYAYVLLWMALSDQKVTANHALQLLEKQFSTPGPRRLPCVVLMDELDLLVTSKQTVMYNFFEWPTWLHSRLIVVAVANTMDLPERMLSNKVSSRMGLTRINFQPYTYQQLVKIVESRLEGVKAFRREAIEFAARKVGAVSGDARRALDICRRAVEIVESNSLKNSDEGGDPEQVTIRTVDQAIKEMFASPNVRLIQTASLHQKLFLVALTSKLRRLGLAEVEFSEVAHSHLQMCRLHHIEPPLLSDLSAICASLGSSRCLLVESGKQDIHQRVRLSVSEEDVIMALKSDPLFKRLLDTLPSAPS